MIALFYCRDIKIKFKITLNFRFHFHLLPSDVSSTSRPYGSIVHKGGSRAGEVKLINGFDALNPPEKQK